MPVNFVINDLVWAKMKGFAPWPGRVCQPPASISKKPKGKGPQHCILFFGSNNFAWIEEQNVKPYDEFKEKFGKSNRQDLKDAITAIESHIAKKEAGTLEEEVAAPAADDFDKLMEDDEDDVTLNVTNVTVEEPTPSAKPKKQRKRKENGEESVPKRKKKAHSSPDRPIESLVSPSLSVSPRKPTVASALMERPPVLLLQPRADMNLEVSEHLKAKSITPSDLKFGFLGLGIMGSGMVKNLINSGHSVVVWNRTSDKCQIFQEIGAEVMQTPSDVVEACNVTFSCVSDPTIAKQLVFGNCGVNRSMSVGKAFVEMTTIDPTTSLEIEDTIKGAGGRYLEAQVQGSRVEADEGSLVIVAAGDRSLFDDVQSCFEAMSTKSFFLGVVGNASKMSLALNMISGIMNTGLAEAMTLANASQIEPRDLLTILEHTRFASPVLIEKARAIVSNEYATNQCVSLMQKDLRLALALGDEFELPLHVTAAANELYKNTQRRGYRDHDIAAVYLGARY